MTQMSTQPNTDPAQINPLAAHVGPAAASGLEELPPRRKEKPSLRVAALNITSMLDLTFNLLLFFVLTANFAAGEGALPADLPAGTGGVGSGPVQQPSAAPPANPVVIALRAVGQNQVAIQIKGANTALVNFDDLREKLDGWRQDDSRPAGIYKADNPILIQPERDVRWEHVVDAFSAVTRAKYTSVGFTPTPKE